MSRMWEAPDGTFWFWMSGNVNGWLGFNPGEIGVWFMTDDDFRKEYPDAPVRKEGGA